MEILEHSRYLNILFFSAQKAVIKCKELILMIDSDEMVDSSSTVLDYLKLLFKYIKPFPEIKNKVDSGEFSIAFILPGVLPSIFFASVPTATTVF